jgi:hypothetical protein
VTDEGSATDHEGDGLDLGAVVEAMVYAPLGLALEGRSLLPRLVERGRNHVTMARMVGEFAVRKGAEDLAAGAVGAQERLIGLLPWTRGGSDGATGSDTTSTGPEAARSAPVDRPASPPTAARVAPEAAAAAADIDPGDLPIPDYDLLSASLVVPRLESLDAAELDLVGRYEAGTRGRRTILAKVAQLRSGSAG